MSVLVIASQFTVRFRVFDGVPPEPLRTCTVNEPAASVAGPLTLLALVVRFPFGTTQSMGVPQPGPRKNTSTVLGSKSLPESVKLNCCPPSGGEGEVETLPLSDGVALPTVRFRVFDGVPPEPLRTCTVNEPAASVAGPLTLLALVVRLPFGTTQSMGVPQPGPRKNTSTVLGSKSLPESVKLNCCPPSGGEGEVETLPLSDGVALPTVRLRVFDGVPPEPLRTCTVNEPAASVAGPLTLLALVVRFPFGTTQSMGVPQPGPRKNTSIVLGSKSLPESVKLNCCPPSGGEGEVETLPLSDGVALPTVRFRVFDGVPPEPLRTCTVNEPAASVAGPLTLLALVVRFPFGTTQSMGVPQPGPRKNTSIVLGSKSLPESVKLNCCPPSGGEGEVETLPLSDGVALPTVRFRVFDGVPPEPLRTCTVNEPAASVAGPLTLLALVVRFPFGTTQSMGVPQPGPRKNTSTVLGSKSLPESVKLNCCPPSGGEGEVETLPLSDGVALPTVRLRVFDGVPPEPLRTCTVNEPAASVAGPLTLLVRVHGKMNESPLLELEDLVARVAVEPVLPDGVLHTLPAQRVLEFRCGHGQAVEAEGQVERVRMVRAVLELPGDGEPVGLVAPLRLRIHPAGWSEESHAELLAEALEAVADHGQ